MLHNSGAYGPNDTPHNTNTPVNMTQVTAPLNMGRNMQNMGEMVQPPLRGPSGHYNLPNYPPYHHPGLDMRSNLDNFSKGFQHHYMSPNSALRWPNGMSPLNLNAQSTYVPNAQNFHTSFDKTLPNSLNIPLDVKDTKMDEKSAISSESSQKTTNEGSYYYNSHQDIFNNYSHNFPQNISKDKPLMDDSKRRSLENTVKLIENILINTTKESQNALNSSNSTEMYDYMSKTLLNCEEPKDHKLHDYVTNKSDDKIENSNKMNENDDKADDFKEIPVETDCDIRKETNNTCPKQEELPSVEPAKETVKIKIEIDICSTNEDDDEYNLEFCKDFNGISKEEMDQKIAISQNSINEASDAMKNGVTWSECYYECPYCKLLFTHCKRFLIHTKWHIFGLTNEKRNVTAREKELQKQQRKEAKIVDQLHKTMEEDGVTYTCKDCPKIFCSKGSLKNHRTRFHSGRIRECGICGAVAMGWAGLKAHAATHTSPFQCNACDKVFRHKHSLQRHAETHMQEEEKTLRCEQCGKLFAVPSRLKEHMRCHARAERGAVYQCSYCAKSFFQAYSLTIHERTHRNEKPYHCDICNASYGTNSSLKRHMKVSHNQSKPFVCSQCLRCFISARALHGHIVRVHADGTDPEFKKRRRRPKDPNQKLVPKEPKAKKTKKEPETKPEIEPVAT